MRVGSLLGVMGVILAVTGCSSSGSTGEPAPTTTATSAPAAVPPSTATLPPDTEPARLDEVLAGSIVVIDPGHNGRNFEHLDEINAEVDIGIGTKACNTTGTATADGVSEATVNFAVAELVRDRLLALGADVVMTRTDNDGWGPCITERAAIGNRAGADAVVSIHADGGPETERGFHVIHPALIDGFTDDIAADSLRLATELRDALRRSSIPPAEYVGVDGLDERGDLGGLVLSDVAAVFVEMGNLRNDTDARILTDPAGRAEMAALIVDALMAYLDGS